MADGDDYHPRTPERLVEILRAQSQNQRSWPNEAADTIERLRNAAATSRDGERGFRELVAKVEERFRPELGAIEGSGAGSEGKYEPKMVSTGWWVVLARFGIAMRFGSGKPDIEPGDELLLIARRIPKKPDAPALAVVPPAPPPVDVRAQLVHLCETAAPENADKAKALLATFDAFAGTIIKEPTS